MIRIEISCKKIGDVAVWSFIPDENLHLLNISKLKFEFPKVYKYIEIVLNGRRFGY